MTLKTGVLLPHFGSHADFGLIREGAARAEAHGFDSVWVRDHVLYEPHAETDDPDPAFLEATLTLAAVAAATTRVALGTSALVPLRHPLITTKLLATLSAMFGRPLHVGMGAGGFDHEFAALGWPTDVPRRHLVDVTAHVCRELWAGRAVSVHDEVFDFTDVRMEPQPSPAGIDMWLCGSGLLAAKRAARAYDGWMPARITVRALEERREAMAAICSETARDLPTIALLGLTSISQSRSDAMDRLPVAGLLDWANRNKFAQTWPRPATGRYETEDDIAGMFLGGNPDDIVAQVRGLQAAGVSHVVFDLRNGFETWVEQIDLLGREVLPVIARPV